MISRRKIIDWLKGMKYITVDENSTTMSEDFENEHKSELITNITLERVINYIKYGDENHDLFTNLTNSFDKFIELVKKEESVTQTNIYKILIEKFTTTVNKPLSYKQEINNFMYMITEAYSAMTKDSDIDIVEYSSAYLDLMLNLRLLYDDSDDKL